MLINLDIICAEQSLTLLFHTDKGKDSLPTPTTHALLCPHAHPQLCTNGEKTRKRTSHFRADKVGSMTTLLTKHAQWFKTSNTNLLKCFYSKQVADKIWWASISNCQKLLFCNQLM